MLVGVELEVLVLFCVIVGLAVGELGLVGVLAVVVVVVVVVVG